MNDENRCLSIKQNLKPLAIRDADTQIATKLLEIIK